MTEKSAADAPAAKPSSRTGIAIVILIALAGFAAYGFFERTRLVAAQEQEKEAITFIKGIKGAVIESDSKDWRQLFVPDQPEMAIRVGTVTVPIMGAGPDYTKKVVERLKTFNMCEQLYLADAPVVRAPGSFGMGGGGAKPKEEVKEDEGDQGPMEMLDVAIIRKEFPNLKIVGEETAAKDAAAKIKAKEEAAARKKEQAEKKKESAESQTPPDNGGEKKAEDKAAQTPSENSADKPAESGEKKTP